MSPQSNRITDETYHKMSQLAYDDLYKGDKPSSLQGWEVLEDFESNSLSGFDAVTFYNPDTQQAVIAYRGTEATAGLDHSAPDFLMDVDIGLNEIGRKKDQFLDSLKPPGWNEGVQKFQDATGITGMNEWLGNVEKSLDKTSMSGQFNQLYQAENYAKSMQKKHPELSFSATGHSLGGGNAQYAAAYTGMTAVTFSAPSVMASLTPEMRRKAEEGVYDSQVTNFGHPGDVVASGALGGYDRHVGSTYYINSNYEDANRDVSILDKAKNSFSGSNYHGLQQYEFQQGYISNELYHPVTGEKIALSPRVPSSYAADLFSNIANGLGFLGALTAAGGGRTIQVTPEELMEVASRWNQNAERVTSEMHQIRHRLNGYLQASHSRRLTPIVQQIDTTITGLSHWYPSHTGHMISYIKAKAHQFREADESR